MGAADALASGIRRAVRGVRSALPGPAAPSAGAGPVADPVLTETAPDPVPAATDPEPDNAPTAAPTRPAAATHPSRPAPDRAPAPTRLDATPAFPDAELVGFRTALESELERLRAELHIGEVDLADLVADAADDTGDDPADTGSKRLEREQEMSVNANTRDLIDQTLRALRRLDDGTYGLCESCGTRIRAGRLRAYPRATLCITCKQAEERR